MERKNRHSYDIKHGSSIHLKKPKQPQKIISNKNEEDSLGNLDEKYDGDVDDL